MTTGPEYEDQQEEQEQEAERRAEPVKSPMASTLEQRVRAVLGTTEQKSTWEDLICLFHADREAFYSLACDGVSGQSDSRLKNLVKLAADVHTAVRETYQFETASGGSNVTTFSGKKVFVPSHLVSAVADFLREIDGKLTMATSGKDYLGEEISEAEVRFKLGDRSTWKSERGSAKRY